MSGVPSADPTGPVARATPILGSIGLLWVAAPIWYLLCEAIAASAFPGYSYATFFISDLGVPDGGALDGRTLDSPLHAVMNAGFLGEGLLFGIGLALLAPMLRRGVAGGTFLVLGAIHAAGVALVGLVPGSPANAENGLMIFHIIGAIAAIAGGNLVAIVSKRAVPQLGRYEIAGPVLGGLGFVSAALLVGHVLLPDGISERGAVDLFMVWQLGAGIALWRARDRAGAGAGAGPGSGSGSGLGA
ncbi:DUF998 domain-containing protein [Leucobacter sp. HNU]|uniref:DUF998 domain-containing protein n=1 Tax=Leucobacter sp. HNU TaxID=3236805 RepID=UPI003A811383